MKLFRFAYPMHIVPTSTLLHDTLITPLGALEFKVGLNEQDVCTSPCDSSVIIAPNTYLWGWYHPHFDLEILVHLREGDTTRQSIFLRLRTKCVIDQGWAYLKWSSTDAQRRCFPDSEQWVHATLYAKGEHIVRLATEDNTLLGQRAAENIGVPHQWLSYLSSQSIPSQESWYWKQSIHESVDIEGVAIPFPPIFAHQECRLQIFSSWGLAEEQGTGDFLSFLPAFIIDDDASNDADLAFSLQ